MKNLTLEQLENVNGGWVPVVAAAVGAVVGYYTANSTDDCTTVTRTEEYTDDNGVTHTTTVSSTECY